MTVEHSPAIPGYLEKLRGHENDLASFLNAFEELNETDWRNLAEDILQESPRGFDIFRPSHGHALLEVAATYARQLSFRMQQRWAGSVEALISEKRNRSDYGNLLSHALYFATVLRDAFSSAVLIDLIRNKTIPEEFRLKAGRALANQGESVPISYWNEFDLLAFPAMASALVSAVAKRQPVLALEKLQRLPDAPVDIGSLEYPLRFALRTLLGRPNGSEYLGRFLLVSPMWLKNLLQEVLDLYEFETYREEFRGILASNSAALGETDFAVHVLEEYCSGRLQISPWELDSNLARKLGIHWRGDWPISHSTLDSACRLLIEKWQPRIIENDLFSRRLEELAKHHLTPEEVANLSHVKNLLREDAEFDLVFSNLMKEVERQSQEQECDDAEYEDALR